MDECRTDYPKILDSISDIKVDIGRLVTLVEERNTSAILWREEVCGKFKEIKSYCALRQESKVRMWVGICLAFTVPMLALAVVWGKTIEQVDSHRDKLVKMESQIERLQLK